MARGVLTDEVKQLSKRLLGYEVGVKGLRLLPYLMYCLMDNSNIDVNRVNTEERKILMQWQKEKRLESPASNFLVSSDFYDIMCKLLRVGYCSEMIL